MAPPPGKAPGNGPADQGPSDKELEELRQKAAMQAMMDDLGIARVEALPLADAPRDRTHGAGANDRRRPLPPPPHIIAAMRGGAMQDAVRNTPAQRGWTVNELWKDAMEAGVFNDDEARGVEKLNDLGGGRIYDTATDISARVKDLSVKILDHRSKRSFNPSHDQACANKRVCFNEQPKKTKNRKKGQAGAASQPQQHAAHLAQSSTTSAKPANLNPMSRPNRVPPPPAPPLRLPVPHMAVDLNAPLPFELPHVVFKTSAEFLSRDINPALPAIILLSAAGQPEMGFFTVVLLGRKFCQWPISAWYDYSSGADLGLLVSFKDSHGVSQGYQLFFVSQDSLMDFMATVRSLQAGDYMDRVDHGLVSGNTPAQAGGTTAIPSNGVGGTHTKPPTTSPAVNADAVSAVALTTTHRLATTTDGLNGDGSPSPNQSGNPNQATLIDFEANDASSVASQHPSESTELLSTLEPYGHDIDTGSPSTGMSREAVLLVVRSLFQFFLCSQAGGAASTVEQFNAMAQAVKEGVLQHIMNGARSEGLSGPKIEALKDTINGVLAGVIRDHRATGQDVFVNSVAENMQTGATAGDGGRRIRYSVEELVSMRHAAVEPPASMADIPHLPRPGQRTGQSRGFTTSRALTEDLNGRSQPPLKRRPSMQLYQVRKSIDWVMGENSDPAPVTAPEKTVNAESEKADFKADSERSSDAESKKSLNTEPEEASRPASGSTTREESAREAAPDTSSAVPRRAVTDMGLGHSRWAVGVSEVKHANSFTGPRYEKLSSKSSYWKDLSQLDPQTKVHDVGNEDLVDIFFPMPSNNNVERRAASASASTSTGLRGGSNHDTQMSTPAGATTPRTDKIENLRIGISRLTIQSPRTSRPPQGNGLSGLPSPLATQFHTPAATVQPPSTEPAHPRVQSSLTETTNPPVQSPSTEPANASVQSSSTTQSPSGNPPAPVTGPGLRGLGASRHCSGNAPASSGKFDFHLPGAKRK